MSYVYIHDDEYRYNGPSADEKEKAEARLRRIEQRLGIKPKRKPRARSQSDRLSYFLKNAYEATYTDAIAKAARRG